VGPEGEWPTPTQTQRCQNGCTVRPRRHLARRITRHRGDTRSDTRSDTVELRGGIVVLFGVYKDMRM
jgi:hypothetical protein